MQRPPSRSQTAFLTFSGIFVAFVSFLILPPFQRHTLEFFRRERLNALLFAVLNDQINEPRHLLCVVGARAVVANDVRAARNF